MRTPNRSKRLILSALAVTLAATALQYAPPAEAHWRRGGWFVGGLVVGAALAPRYVYSAPAYVYPPPVVYSAPPPVIYAAPPPPVVVQPAPAVVAAPAPVPAQALPLDERLRRLRSLCEQGLLTVEECHSRREQILREL